MKPAKMIHYYKLCLDFWNNGKRLNLFMKMEIWMK